MKFRYDNRAFLPSELVTLVDRCSVTLPKDILIFSAVTMSVWRNNRVDSLVSICINNRRGGDSYRRLEIRRVSNALPLLSCKLAILHNMKREEMFFDELIQRFAEIAGGLDGRSTTYSFNFVAAFPDGR